MSDASVDFYKLERNEQTIPEGRKEDLDYENSTLIYIGIPFEVLYLDTFHNPIVAAIVRSFDKVYSIVDDAITPEGPTSYWGRRFVVVNDRRFVLSRFNFDYMFFVDPVNNCCWRTAMNTVLVPGAKWGFDSPIIVQSINMLGSRRSWVAGVDESKAMMVINEASADEYLVSYCEEKLQVLDSQKNKS
jgi:hypothetical protein